MSCTRNLVRPILVRPILETVFSMQWVDVPINAKFTRSVSPDACEMKYLF